MANNRIFNEDKPVDKWTRSDDADIVKMSLPGYKREHLRVLVDNHGHLRTRGERPVAGNRWSRFQKDFDLPANCNVEGIRAKFENEWLTITLPKHNPSAPRRPVTAPAAPQPAARPTAPAPPAPVPAVPLAPVPSVKPPAAEPRPSMPRRQSFAPVPAPPPALAPAPEVEPPATTKPHQPPLAAVQRPKEVEEAEKQRAREAAGKMAEDRKEMAQEKATEQQQQQQEEAMPLPPADSMATAYLQPRPPSASRGLLVNVAVAVVVLLGVTVYVWHSLRNATGGAGEHGHGRLGAGSYGDEM